MSFHNAVENASNKIQTIFQHQLNFILKDNLKVFFAKFKDPENYF